MEISQDQGELPEGGLRSRKAARLWTANWLLPMLYMLPCRWMGRPARLESAVHQAIMLGAKMDADLSVWLRDYARKTPRYGGVPGARIPLPRDPPRARAGCLDEGVRRRALLVLLMLLLKYKTTTIASTYVDDIPARIQPELNPDLVERSSTVSRRESRLGVRAPATRDMLRLCFW